MRLRRRFKTAALLAVLTSLTVASTRCGGEIRTVEKQVVSPSGGVVAELITINEGGATVGFQYEVRVRATSSADEGEWIFRSYRVRPREVTWETDRAVILVVPADDIAEYGSFIKRRERLGVRSVLRPVVTGG